MTEEQKISLKSKLVAMATEVVEKGQELNSSPRAISRFTVVRLNGKAYQLDVKLVEVV